MVNGHFSTAENRTWRSTSRAEGDGLTMGGLFLWGILLSLLSALCIFSWVFCIYVFGHPDIPFCYDLLWKMKQLEPLEGFTLLNAPRGEFLDDKKIYQKFYAYEDRALVTFNKILKRYYIRNYYRPQQRVPYVTGKYRIYKIQNLKPDDVFPRGLVLRAKSVGFPNTHIEYVLPVDPDEPVPDDKVQLGDVLVLRRSRDLSAVLHARRIPSDAMLFTVIPLRYAFNEFPLQPPIRLNLHGKWPISTAGVATGKPPKAVKFPAEEESEPAPDRREAPAALP